MVSVDVSKYTDLATQEGITQVPTMKLYNGKVNVADYSGVRSQADLSRWLFLRIKPIELQYNTAAWSAYTQSAYGVPLRFIYVYMEGESPNIKALYDSVKGKGVLAKTALPADQVQAFLKSYDLRSLPVFATCLLGRLNTIKMQDIETIGDTTTGRLDSKRFGDDASDPHSTFTFLFFLIGMIGIGVFAYRNISIPKRPVDMSKSVWKRTAMQDFFLHFFLSSHLLCFVICIIQNKYVKMLHLNSNLLYLHEFVVHLSKAKKLGPK